MMSSQSEPKGDRRQELQVVEDAARALAGAAFAALREENLIPPSRYHPYLEVGRDYEGGVLRGLAECAHLEQELNSTFNERFRDPLKRPDYDFANLWIFSFVEACIARCSRNEEPFEVTSSGVDQSITELVTALSSPEGEVACCRVVSHLSTVDGSPVEVGGVLIVPDSANDLFQEIGKHIPGGTSAFNRDPPWPMELPLSLIVVRDHGFDRHNVGDLLSRRISRFLRLVRLALASTAQSLYEIRGETTLVRRYKPELVVFSGSKTLVQRTVKLSSNDDSAVSGIGQLVDAMARRPKGILMTSFGLALAKFDASFQSGGWDEQIIDLMTALEGALSGTSKTDVVLRLETRAAALLAEPNDSAGDIFNDLKNLYDLRSKLVHGGTLKESELTKKNYGISTVPKDAPAGTAAAYMVDRLRDLARRSILARVALGTPPDPLWPIVGDEGVDATLSDDATREQWRSAWRKGLSAVGAGTAANRARPANEFFFPEER